ncbi:MAG: lipid-A-disaccharide synthase [Rhodospirillum sp.]|nr:lipid-A-disaccharide synthase [Rhodospirillum sp.]MCF8488447.1 lipid-A-disaccharide synthase [Rhodospirillum sp.]MCF8499109.1 lipid-A-disaccharide synthase [Rhodospirillum sp.]
MNTDVTSDPLIFIIAGEPSGDQLGAHLMDGLRVETGGRVRFAGIGGDRMTEQGLKSLVPLSELSIMGFLEVLPSIPRILRRLRETVEAIRTLKPAAVVTIDSWGFTGRVHKAMIDAGMDCPRIHYVAPMVWVYKADRVHKVAARVHHQMCLWPFEPPLFEAAGLPSSHVGHSIIETGAGTGDGAAFRARHGIPETAPLLAVLPGSRRGEIRHLLPVFAQAVARIQRVHPELHVVLPTLRHLREDLERRTGDWPCPVAVVTSVADKYDGFAASSTAIAASGTVSLELALARVPHLIAYKANWISVVIFSRLVKVRFFDMVNILLDRAAVPELLQHRCTPRQVADQALALMVEGPERTTQLEDMALAVDLLRGDGSPPSRQAARQVLAHLRSES